MSRPSSLLSAIGLAVALVGPGLAQSGEYIFLAPVMEVPQGGTHRGTILFSQLGPEVQSCALDLCHDPSVVEPTEVALGFSIFELGGAGGTAYTILDVLPDGISMAFITSFSSAGWYLPSGSVHEIGEVEYFGVGVPGDVSLLEFCDIGTTINPPSAGGVTVDVVVGQVEVVEPFPGVFHIEPEILDPHLGLPFSVRVELDHPEVVDAFEFSIEHDPEVLGLLGAFEGADVLAGTGPESFIAEIHTEGLTVSCVVDPDPFEGLPVGDGQSVAEIFYLPPLLPELTCTYTRLRFSENVGVLPVPTTVTVAGTPEAAVGRDRTLRFDVLVPAFPSGGHTLSVGSEEGLSFGEFVSVPVRLDTEEPIAGFSFGIAHDESFATIDDVLPGWALGSLFCGGGPEVFVSQTVPGGVTVACLVDAGTSFMGETLPAGAGLELVRIDYLLDGGGPSSALELVDTLGPVPVAVELSSAGGQSIVPDVVHGVLSAIPVFRRGDCNGDLLRNIGDAVFSLEALLGIGAPQGCSDACDTNDDGLFDLADPVYLLNVLFVTSAPELPEPTGCGPDETVDLLGCETFDSCL